MIHLAYTRKESSTYLACNTTNLKPSFAYVHLTDKMSLKRVATTISNGSAAAATYGLAIYRAVPAPFDRNRPLKNIPPINLTLVSNLGTLSTSVTTPQRFNATLPRELIIDGASSFYYIGFVCSDVTVGRWRSGSATNSNIFPYYALDGLGLLTSPGVWPTNISASRTAVDLPAISLRSSEGIFFLGSASDDP